MSFQRILVACDFSAPASRALAYAYGLSQKLGSALEVVHVHPELYDARGDATLGLPWPSTEQTDRYLRFLNEELKRTLQGVAPELAEKARCHILRGEPVRRILALAEELGADLICVASTGKNGVERVLMGSVSQSLLRESAVPVLVVH